MFVLEKGSVNIGAQNRKYRHDQHVFLIAVVPVPLLTFSRRALRPLYAGPPLTSVLVLEFLPGAQTYWLGAVREREVAAVSQPPAIS